MDRDRLARGGGPSGGEGTRSSDRAGTRCGSAWLLGRKVGSMVLVQTGRGGNGDATRLSYRHGAAPRLCAFSSRHGAPPRLCAFSSRLLAISSLLSVSRLSVFGSQPSALGSRSLLSDRIPWRSSGRATTGNRDRTWHGEHGVQCSYICRSGHGPESRHTARKIPVGPTQIAVPIPGDNRANNRTAAHIP